MKLEEIYKEWKSLFPLSEKQTQLLRNKFTTEYNFNSNHSLNNKLPNVFLCVQKTLRTCPFCSSGSYRVVSWSSS